MNWRAVVSVVVAIAGPLLVTLREAHPQWMWIGLATTVVGAVGAWLAASPTQQHVIELQRKELDSLRPAPPPERPV